MFISAREKELIGQNIILVAKTLENLTNAQNSTSDVVNSLADLSLKQAKVIEMLSERLRALESRIIVLPSEGYEQN